MCDKAVYDNPNALKFVPDRYKTPEMYGKAVYDFLPTFHFFPDCFVTSKMIKKLFTVLYADPNILYFDEDFGNVAFD